MLCLPKALGRVRLSAVEDDLLAEHVGAWCDVHADLLTDDEADPAPEDAESALE